MLYKCLAVLRAKCLMFELWLMCSDVLIDIGTGLYSNTGVHLCLILGVMCCSVFFHGHLVASMELCGNSKGTSFQFQICFLSELIFRIIIYGYGMKLKFFIFVRLIDN